MMVLFSYPAHATNVFSNLGSTSGSTSCRGATSPVAYGFITGSNGPYTMNSVTIRAKERGATIEVSIYDDNAGEPGSPVGSFNAITISGTSGTLMDWRTTSAAPIVLPANTPYWLFVRAITGSCLLSNSNIGAPTGAFTATSAIQSGDNGVTWGVSSWGVIAIDASPASSVSSSKSGLLPAFYDGRINDYDTGNPVVLYGVVDGNSSRALHVYDTEGNLLMVVPSVAIDSVADCPEDNTLIAESGDISFWRLAGSCQYQLNAPSLDGSKTYVIIFNELYSGGGYSSYEE